MSSFQKNALPSEYKIKSHVFADAFLAAQKQNVDVLGALEASFSEAIKNHTNALTSLGIPLLYDAEVGLFKTKAKSPEHVVFQRACDSTGRYELETSIQTGAPILTYIAPEGRDVERIMIIAHNEGDAIVFISLNTPHVSGDIMYVRNDLKHINTYMHNGIPMSPTVFDDNSEIVRLIAESGIVEASQAKIWTSAGMIIKALW